MFIGHIVSPFHSPVPSPNGTLSQSPASWKERHFHYNLVNMITLGTMPQTVRMTAVGTPPTGAYPEGADSTGCVSSWALQLLQPDLSETFLTL